MYMSSQLYVSFNCNICKEVLFLINKCEQLKKQITLHIFGKEKFPNYIKTVPFIETEHHKEKRIARYTGEDVVAWVKNKLLLIENENSKRSKVAQSDPMEYDPMQLAGVSTTYYAGIDIENVSNLQSQKSIIPTFDMDYYFTPQQQFNSIDDVRHSQNNVGKKIDNEDGGELVNKLISARLREEEILKAKMASQSGGVNIMPPQKPKRPV